MPARVATIDSVDFFNRLAETMAADPARYERLGDIELRIAFVMRRGADDRFTVGLSFHGIVCEEVTELDVGGERTADCWLDGDIDQWQAMFDNIDEHGHAVGQWTLNTLTLFADRLSLHAADPMGEDRFHRFNQTLQEFVDAAARLDAAV